MRTAALERAGWWADFQYYIDTATFAQVLVQGSMVAIREPLASFRVSAAQWSVRLARSQAAEARRFNRMARGLAPGVISGADVRVGDVAAWLQAMQRRVAYLVLARRMRPIAQSSQM
jgi:hypothetical protein